ncbi:MAG: Lrp/AsnC family transcriptional regulator [Candidatus Heimdallarchaeota archaeon]|nr:Lrp/AsnC family transcriptional regulator [Candidatus Heimdallarchaeota archaeon]
MLDMETPTHQLDDTDLWIIKQLQIDSRTQYRQLAKETGKSLGTIANRIQKLHENGVLNNWSIMVDPEKLGFDLTIVINIEIDVKFLDEINKQIRQIQELFAIYNVTGNFDIIAFGRFYNREHLDRVIHRIINIQHIRRTSSNVVLRNLKEDFRVYFPGDE